MVTYGQIADNLYAVREDWRDQIRAADDLIEALEMILESEEFGCGAKGEPNYIIAARAAIAKAKGE